MVGMDPFYAPLHAFRDPCKSAKKIHEKGANMANHKPPHPEAWF